MITYEFIREAQDFLVENWGEDGKNVIVECFKVKPFNNVFKEFLNYCTCCGGDWGTMLLTGINKLYPNVWEAIPENMGVMAFACLLHTLILCGIDTSE